MPATLEVILSPALYPFKTTTGRHITVVIDVLRFTTSLCAAFDNGVEAVIPVESLEEAKALKHKGYPVAAERDGLKLSFADFGNSAADFNVPEVKGKTLAYSTTNGTIAMVMAAENGPVVAAAFTNSDAVSSWLISQNQNMIILCAGWKNQPCIEDTLCAGALVEKLLANRSFETHCDAAILALNQWKSSKNILQDVVEKATHYKRLLNLGVDPNLSFILQTGVSDAVPVFENGLIIDRKNKY